MNIRTREDMTKDAESKNEERLSMLDDRFKNCICHWAFNPMTDYRTNLHATVIQKALFHSDISTNKSNSNCCYAYAAECLILWCL